MLIKSHQERVYQEYVASRAKEKCTQMDQYYQQVVSRAQAEMAGKYTVCTTVKQFQLLLSFLSAALKQQITSGSFLVVLSCYVPAVWTSLVLLDVKKDLDDNKLRYNEVSEKLMERNRQYQRLQVTIKSSILSPCQLTVQMFDSGNV